MAALLVDGPVGEQPSLELKYYDVSGTTARELRRSLDANRPGGMTSRFGDGRVNWHVHWGYWYKCESGCRVTDANTSVDVTMTLPRWTARESAPPLLRLQWDRYMAALRAHEDGHETIARDAGEAIRKRLLSLAGFATPEALAQGVDQAAKALLDEYGLRERGYDLKTAHGVTEGATFP